MWSMLERGSEVFELWAPVLKIPPTLTWFTVTAGTGTGVCCSTAGGAAVLVLELVALRGSFLGAVFPLRGFPRGLWGFWCSTEGGGNRSFSLAAGLVREDTKTGSTTRRVTIKPEARQRSPSYRCMADHWQQPNIMFALADSRGWMGAQMKKKKTYNRVK